LFHVNQKSKEKWAKRAHPRVKSRPQKLWQTIAGLPDGIHSFIPNIQIWVNFGGQKIVKCWNILYPFWIYYWHLVYIFSVICFFVLFLVFFYPFWYIVSRKIWQTWKQSSHLRPRGHDGTMYVFSRSVTYMPDVIMSKLKLQTSKCRHH
jgi:hypothetical protein